MSRILNTLGGVFARPGKEEVMRPDGKRVKNADPMYTIVPYIMVKRYDAMNMITVDIPVEPMQTYRVKAREKGHAISFLALVIAAYSRTVAEFPLLNRFIVNKRIYDRNEYNVSMVVLKPGEENGTMSKMVFDPGSDVFTVQKIIDEYVSNNRQAGDNNSTDRLITLLLSMPGLISLVVGVLKWMDKHGWMPRKVIDASPFHTSLVVSNLASIRTNHIYHHIYDFGTCSVFIAMGNMREVPRRIKGEIVHQRCLPLGVVMDERICSGSYFAQAFQRLKTYLEKPELLETPYVPAQPKE